MQRPPFIKLLFKLYCTAILSSAMYEEVFAGVIYLLFIHIILGNT